MPVKVVDASALGALLFGEPLAESVVQRLSGARLVAPALLDFEMASICRKKMLRYPEQRQLILQSLELMAGMAIEHVEVPVEAMVHTAERLEVTTYDAAYAWLASTLDAELVTLDARLSDAMQAGSKSMR